MVPVRTGPRADARNNQNYPVRRHPHCVPLWHVPAVLSDHGGLTEQAYDAGLGLALSLVRLWSGTPPSGGLLHAAWDISGGP